MVAIYINGETIEGACPDMIKTVFIDFMYGVYDTCSINIFRNRETGKLDISGFFIRRDNEVNYRALVNITSTFLEKLPGFTLKEYGLCDDPDYEVYEDTLETYRFDSYGINIIDV